MNYHNKMFKPISNKTNEKTSNEAIFHYLLSSLFELENIAIIHPFFI